MTLLDSLPYLGEYTLTSREPCKEVDPELMNYDFLFVDFSADGKKGEAVDWSDNVCSTSPAHAVIDWILEGTRP